MTIEVSATMTGNSSAIHMAEISAPPALAAHARDIAAHSAEALAALQQPDGHFVFELEADATIPSEYIFLNRYLGESEPEREAELADYIRSVQSDSHDGWPLYHGGKFNLSCSVKAYYALKMVGDEPEAPHMVRARNAILAHGGAERANVFTRYSLAIFGQLPWTGVPAMPVELMLMPAWFPVNIWRFSYWSRTVIAPLLVVAAKRGRARNPGGVACQELFVTPPGRIRQWHHNPTGKLWGAFFLKLDRLLQPLEAHVFPRLPARRRAIQAALDFIMPRLNGEDGLGAIFPAMANSVMAFDLIGMDHADPRFVQALRSVRQLVVEARQMRGDRPRYCQPCMSPVWDTALATHALLEGGLEPADPRIRAACDWLAERQILDVKGDWAARAPGLEPGGWAFQYRNDFYPDVDDTAVVGMLLHRVDSVRYAENITRAARWIEGMQSANGGWGAFDRDNTADFLNSIPFADHGALLDPPTVDVTARCVSFLCQIGHGGGHPIVRRGIAFMRAEQEEDGSWFGRWGTNYVYGTWSALCALNAAGADMGAPWIRRAVDWLVARQNPDGGWGENGATYWPAERNADSVSTASQTAWAVLGLMAAGEVANPAVARGVHHLVGRQRTGARWAEDQFTSVGFPRVFYLKYHGYSAYFPTWSLGRYARLMRGNSRSVNFGI